jgi:hypothetical protein
LRWLPIRYCGWSRKPNTETEILKSIQLPARHGRGVAEKRVSCRQLGAYPLVNDQNAGPEEKIPIFTCGLGNFARGSTVLFF